MTHKTKNALTKPMPSEPTPLAPMTSAPTDTICTYYLCPNTPSPPANNICTSSAVPAPTYYAIAAMTLTRPMPSQNQCPLN